jgi:DNA-binding HxlR family transcriptional regulator
MERAIPDISPATLTTRLKKLEECGVVERYVETKDKQSVSYGLTVKGKALVPVLDAVKQFTAEYES